MYQRKEQKQVDVHMATDLLSTTCAGTPPLSHIGLASDDWDLLPAVLAAAQASSGGATTISLLRFGDFTTYLDNDLRALGVQIVEYSPYLGGKK